ncbi:hypothetical protein EVAR_102161_1 [Eumeta japonica]|uniref:Uncharacterized protein n=1 Tax=Eumeta variegata TaxID=151549 RepID=A0A4C1TZX1_EUMVA|nr:hypothetical protein EVAR_102161_1 [Eumeta japonica]
MMTTVQCMKLCRCELTANDILRSIREVGAPQKFEGLENVSGAAHSPGYRAPIGPLSAHDLRASCRRRFMISFTTSKCVYLVAADAPAYSGGVLNLTLRIVEWFFFPTPLLLNDVVTRSPAPRLLLLLDIIKIYRRVRDARAAANASWRFLGHRQTLKRYSPRKMPDGVSMGYLYMHV